MVFNTVLSMLLALHQPKIAVISRGKQKEIELPLGGNRRHTNSAARRDHALAWVGAVAAHPPRVVREVRRLPTRPRIARSVRAMSSKPVLIR